MPPIYVSIAVRPAIQTQLKMMVHGADYAALTVTGQRYVYQYMCPPPGASPHWPSEGPTYALSRGWDYSGMHFDVTNAHGDVQHFHFWLNIYSDDTTFICRRNTGFRLDTWDFPQGVTVKIDYPTTTQTNSHTFNTSPTEGQSFPNSTLILGVENTVGRHLTFTDNQVSDGAGHTLLAPSYGDPIYTGSTTDPAGNVTSFALSAHPVATTRTQRPVPFQQLVSVTTPDHPSAPNVQYVYDPLGQVNQVLDAEAIQGHDRQGHDRAPLHIPDRRRRGGRDETRRSSLELRWYSWVGSNHRPPDPQSAL